jgi:hypothetical protein
LGGKGHRWGGDFAAAKSLQIQGVAGAFDGQGFRLRKTGSENHQKGPESGAIPGLLADISEDENYLDQS